MARVYVSSTFADLKRERRVVMDWLVAAGHHPVHSYLPNSETVRDSCLEDVGSCDLYVLILGHRYGFQPDDGNPGGLSITHLEFRRAGECGIPRLALLRTSKPDDERSSDLQDPARAPMVSGFRDEVARQVRAAEFSNRRGLIQGLSTGIQAELDKLRKRDERQAARGARPASAANSNPSLAPIADRLADAVDSQWKAEAKVRRLNDPYPLPVSWAAANASLTDTWDSLVKLASAGAGWPRPPPAGSWAASPDELAGEGGELADVLARVPTGRLVVLGEPGAGKTMLMVRLVLDLLADRAGGGPVPFLASVASWDPKDQDLRGWLGGQLLIDHPVLAKPLSADSRAPTRAEALLESRLIMPILDGLDEIPEKVRGPAIGRINEALRPGEHLVVTCRSKEYRDAVRPVGGAEVTLRAAAAVQLGSLNVDAVRGYLCDDAAGPVTRARWDPVLAVLGTEAPAGQALTTPLMVGLARTIYNPDPDEPTKALRHPGELTDFADRSAVEAYLFDAFIPAAYRQSAGRWTADEAEPWLVFLAKNIHGSDLAWWDLPQAVPPAPSAADERVWGTAPLGATVRPAVGLGVGLTTGIAAGLTAGIAADLVSAVAVGGTFAVGAGLETSRVARASVRVQPSRGMRLGIGLVPFGIVPGGILAGLMAWLKAGVVAGVAGGLAAGLLFAFLFGLLYYFAVSPVIPRYDHGRQEMRDAVMIVVGIVVGIGAAIVVGVAAALGGISPAVGIAAGIAAGLLFAWIPTTNMPEDSLGDLGAAPSRHAVLALERRTALFFGLMTGVAAGLMAWVAARVVATFGAAEVVSGLVAGLMFGHVAGCCFGFITTRTTWPSYMLARRWLAWRHRLPWRLMSFLADAHRRGVLRQAGAVYQFRHIKLQHRLADRDADKQQANSAAPPTAGH